MNKKEIMSLLSSSLGDNMSVGFDSSGSGYYDTAWNFWHRDYYPNVIRESYPVYIRERAEDKGKKAFEIIKVLQDKKLIKLEKVSDFIDAMDVLINNL